MFAEDDEVAESSVPEAPAPPALDDAVVDMIMDLVLLFKVSCSDEASEDPAAPPAPSDGDEPELFRWSWSRILEGFGAKTEQVTTALWAGWNKNELGLHVVFLWKMNEQKIKIQATYTFDGFVEAVPVFSGR